jgi:transglutaminase-like putative cysteine protease
MNQRIKLTSLFFTRLLLYITVICLPLFHPAIVVPFDVPGWVFWFFLIPVEMFIAFFLAPPLLTFRRWIAAGLVCNAFTSVIVTGFTLSTLGFFAGGVLAFLSTALVFKTKGRGRVFAVLELFYFGVIYYRLLGFSRGSEEIALASHGFTQVILVVAICAFCLHALVIYLASFDEGLHKKSGGELALFAGLSVPLILVVALLLPPDFIRHTIVLNELGQPPESKPLSGDNNLDIGSADQNGGQGKGSNRLEGVPRDRWHSLTRKNSTQYATMLVVTKVDTLYAAGTYNSHFDKQRGFVPADDPSLEDAELNGLKDRHLLQTWSWPGQDRYSQTRKAYDVLVFSITPERYLAYIPFSVEPVSLNDESAPFRYSYASTSALSLASAPELFKLEDLSPDQKQALKPYLDLPLDPQLEQDVRNMTQDVRQSNLTPFGKVFMLLQYFRAYQYEAGFSDDTSVMAISKFLFDTRSGDCTEFSNAFALLARSIGIPSRVVTGYLVSSKLQTPAHKQGVHILRQQLEILKDFPEDEIYLVTSSHRHSWAQVYMPVFGWIDVETTQFARPPLGGQDPNNWKVIIPYNEQKPEEQNILRGDILHTILVILIILGALFVLMIVALYAYRFGLLAYYSLRSRSSNAGGLHALYVLLLMRLAFHGYTVKKAHQTINEYAQQYGELNGFARGYTELRYKTSISPANRKELWSTVRREYKGLARKLGRRGFLHRVQSWFSLRGLFYRW